jgi:GNAT superfamily N-acetyltransferase
MNTSQNWRTASGSISANVSPTVPTRGYIGFFQPAQLDQGRELLQTAIDWLLDQGVQDIYGPINTSTWFDYRYLLETTSGPTFSWEPAHPEYVAIWKQCGFEICEEYHSRAFDNIHTALPKTEASYQKFKEAGFSTRPFAPKNEIAREIQHITRINQASFDRAFLSEPISADDYQNKYVPQFVQYVGDLSFFILNPEGKEVGYFFLFQDQGDGSHPYLIWKTLALTREHQGQGLATFGIHHALKLAQVKGLDSMVAALIRKGAPSEMLLAKIYDLKWEHRYGVFHLKG